MVNVLQRKDQTSIVCRQVMNQRLHLNLRVKLLQFSVALGVVTIGIWVIVLAQ
jgi:hypothetical protein